ncbi:MAG: hypothetical protein CVU99_01895 [Firmicutes bacterium HGW-Firmicutes-4]|nr:MAG: hypothetical protein CVU99_01895 [Firmicutes bacterium HGW-Firmicutes-4]
MVDKILTGVAAPINLGNERLTVTVSIGMAIYPDTDRDIEVLIKKSDLVIYQVKNNGRNSAHFYNTGPDLNY